MQLQKTARALLLTLGATTCVVQAAHESAAHLSPLAFLAGHCWTAPFPDGKSTDTHCFEWVYGQHQLRDRHVVKGAGSGPEYRGETLYLWDAKTSRIVYRYIDSTGGHSNGYVEPADDALRFPDDNYVAADGKTISFVTQWRRVDADHYEAKTRQRVGDELKDVFSFRFTRQAPQ